MFDNEWKLGTFFMRPQFEPRTMDVNLLQARIRMTQDDRYDQQLEIRNKIGGPGRIYFASPIHPNLVYAYDVYQWLETSNCSLPSLVQEMNGIFKRYFRFVLGWNWNTFNDHAPVASIGSYKKNWHHIKFHAQKNLDSDMASKFSLFTVVDPNLTIALKLVGYNWVRTENDWFHFLPGSFNEETHRLEITKARTWADIGRSAVYPVNEDAYINWMWDVIYPIDKMAGVNISCECLAYRRYPNLSREEQVLRHLKDVIFPDWQFDERGDEIIKRIRTLEYRPNQHDPSIRQLVIHVSGRDEWYRMSFTFSRLLVQLFNWNERLLYNGNTVNIDHTSSNEFLIDFTDRHPPSYDFLNDKSLIHTENMNYQQKRIQLVPGSKRPAMVLNEPAILPMEDRLVGIYHLSINAPRVFCLLPREHFCDLKRCTHTELVFDLDRVPGGGKRSYDLQSLSIVIKGRILAANGTSTLKTAPISPLDSLFVSMIKNVQLSLSSKGGSKYIIDTSNGLYRARDYLLEILQPPIFDEKNEQENKFPAGIAGSQEFTTRIYPFKHKTAPSNQLLSSNEMTLKVALHEANNFVINRSDPTAKYLFELNRSECKVEFKDSIKFTDEIEKASEYVRYRHVCLYDFMQYNIVSTLIPKGRMEWKSGPLMKRTKATTWIIAMRKIENSLHHQQQKMPEKYKFELFNLVRIDLKEGETSIDGPLHVGSNIENSTQCYKRFVHARSNHTEISQEEFLSNKAILVFHRGRNRGEDKFITIDLLFSEALPFDIELICLAEIAERIEVDYMGDVSKHLRTDDKSEHHTDWFEADGIREEYSPPPKGIKECRNELLEIDNEISTTLDEFLTVRETKYKTKSNKHLEGETRNAPAAAISTVSL